MLNPADLELVINHQGDVRVVNRSHRFHTVVADVQLAAYVRPGTFSAAVQRLLDTPDGALFAHVWLQVRREARGAEVVEWLELMAEDPDTTEWLTRRTVLGGDAAEALRRMHRATRTPRPWWRRTVDVVCAHPDVPAQVDALRAAAREHFHRDRLPTELARVRAVLRPHFPQADGLAGQELADLFIHAFSCVDDRATRRELNKLDDLLILRPTGTTLAEVLADDLSANDDLGE